MPSASTTTVCSRKQRGHEGEGHQQGGPGGTVAGWARCHHEEAVKWQEGSPGLHTAVDTGEGVPGGRDAWESGKRVDCWRKVGGGNQEVTLDR